MPKLPVVSAADLVKAFAKLGFRKVSQKGSHIKLKDKLGRTAVMPNVKEIKIGTLKQGILKPLGISTEELIKLLKK